METMSTSEAAAWIIAAAEQAGLLGGYKDSLQFLMKAGLVPDDLKEEAEEVMKL